MSEDGKWVWDGSQWQGRQLSEDGKWVWDGSQWQPINGPQPQSGRPPQTRQQLSRQRPKRTTRRRLLTAVLVMFGVIIGGYLIAVGILWTLFSFELHEESERPGASNNPLTVHEGEPFEVAGFNYSGGWSVERERGGVATIEGLEVTNNRGAPGSAALEVAFWRGSEPLAVVGCTTQGSVAPETTVRLSCTPRDLSNDYNKITVRDTLYP